MLTKPKLDSLCAKPDTKEKQIICTLYRNFVGAVDIDELLVQPCCRGMSKSTLKGVHIKRSPYLEYDRTTDIVSLRRKGKEISRSWGVNLDNPWDTLSIGGFCMSLFLTEGLDYPFEEMANCVDRWCEIHRKPKGAFRTNKTAHYGFYKNQARRYLIARGDIASEDI